MKASDQPQPIAASDERLLSNVCEALAYLVEKHASDPPPGGLSEGPRTRLIGLLGSPSEYPGEWRSAPFSAIPPHATAVAEWGGGVYNSVHPPPPGTAFLQVCLPLARREKPGHMSPICRMSTQQVDRIRLKMIAWVRNCLQAR